MLTRKRPCHSAVYTLVLSSIVLPCEAQKKMSATPKGALTYEAIRNLSDDEFKQLQYYSNGFDLVRVVSNTSDHRASSTLVTTHNQTYEVIRFKKGTPGTATLVSRRGENVTLSISFEQGCSIKYMLRADQRGPHGGFLLALEKNDEIEYLWISL